MTQQSNRDAWRKFLGISDARNGRADARTGVGVGRSAGRASGAAITDRNGNPEGEDDGEDSAVKGNGALDASKRLNPGDNGDRFEDLYDCETGEKVTLDGLGKEGTQAYPVSFQGCNDPNAGDYPSFVWYYEMRTREGSNAIASQSYTKSWDAAVAWITGQPRQGWDKHPTIASFNGEVIAQASNSGGSINAPSYRQWTVIAYNKNITPPPWWASETKWPQVDKNHLNWNKDKGCYEPLCPELNTQVADKFKTCDDEFELCDKPVGGKKVKVKVKNGVTEVTQERYNQTATIKDGKVTSVKALSESQTEAAFR